MQAAACHPGRKIQAALEGRLGGYPARAAQQMHTARVAVPAAVAAVLRAEPDLVAPAVERFYNRDVEDMRAAARMRRFPPRVRALLLSSGVWVRLSVHAMRMRPAANHDMPEPCRLCWSSQPAPLFHDSISTAGCSCAVPRQRAVMS